MDNFYTSNFLNVSKKKIILRKWINYNFAVWKCQRFFLLAQRFFRWKLFRAHTIQVMINSSLYLDILTNFNSLHNSFQRDLHSQNNSRERWKCFMKRVIKFYAYLFYVMKVFMKWILVTFLMGFVENFIKKKTKFDCM